MQIYNYDYDDMRELTFSMDDTDDIKFHSQIYPTKLEVKIDKEIDRPYLYYEGLVLTNRGCFKITFPKLDLVLNCVDYKKSSWDEWDYPRGLKNIPSLTEYEIITKFNNIGENRAIFELTHLSTEEYKDIAEQLWKGVRIVGENTNGEA